MILWEISKRIMGYILEHNRLRPNKDRSLHVAHCNACITLVMVSVAYQTLLLRWLPLQFRDGKGDVGRGCK